MADATIKQHFGETGVRLDHDGCAGTVTASYDQIRTEGAVSCPECGTELMTYDFLLESVDDGIAESARNPNAEQRQLAIDALSDTKQKLVR